MNIGWRPHDLETPYLPFGHIEVGRSDSDFMAKHGLQPVIDQKAKKKLLQEGDEETVKEMKLGQSWVLEDEHGSWEDIRFLRDSWEGPLILKGIQHVEDAGIRDRWDNCIKPLR